MMDVTIPPSTAERITALLSRFRLPTLAADLVSRFVKEGQADSLGLVLELLEAEAGDRHHRRVDRLLRASKLPVGKTFETLQDKRLPRAVSQSLHKLAQGEFLDRAGNILAFGLPGTGKTHAACALGHSLVSAGRSVYFSPAYALVQELLAAKRDLRLPAALRKFDIFELLILDDIGYVQQSAEEVEVLFTLLAERYERASVLITSNLVFSQWDKIFHNPMTTAAAIDRLVHHSVILEFNVKSYRGEEAQSRATNPSEPTEADSPKPKGGR
jgi:DNA replication protein DnaC